MARNVGLKVMILIALSIVSFFITPFLRKPELTILVFFIGTIPIIWALINYENYDSLRDFRYWMGSAVKNIITFGPLLAVLIVLLASVLMDLRLITVGDEIRGRVIDHVSDTYVKKSSGKVSSQYDWVEYIYAVNGKTVKSKQEFMSIENIPDIGDTTIIYDPAFPLNNSKLSNTFVRHFYDFIPLFIWGTVGGVVWMRLMTRLGLQD